MGSKPASELQPTTPSASPKIVEVETLLDRMKRVYESIAERAYEIFSNRGFEHGRAVDDWLRAEADLLHPVPVEILESDSEVVVHAEVPGFTAKDLEVSVEPDRVIVNGKRETSSETRKGERVYTERSASEIFRSLSLPARVEPGSARATLADGVLTLTMGKATEAEPRRVEVQSE